MDAVLIPVDKKLTDQANQIADLEKQLAAHGVSEVAYRQLQLVVPEFLWYEARDQNAPHTGPHGTLKYTAGNPATVEFDPLPAAEVGGHSDNVFCLRRMINLMSSDEVTRLKTAKHFSLGVSLNLNDPAKSQAIELDLQRQIGLQITNMGLQLHPGTSATAPWFVRGFDYGAGHWKPIPNLSIDPSLFTGSKTLEVTGIYSCDGTLVNFEKVTFNGKDYPANFSHPVVNHTGAQSIQWNAAFQLDGKADGSAYIAKVGIMNASFS